MSEGTRRRFDKEFKMETARLMVEKGRKASELSGDLDIHENVLRKWRHQYLEDAQHAYPGKGHLKPEEEETRRPKKKLSDVEEERDILKNGTGHLLKTPEMKYQFMEEYRSSFRVEKMCRVCDISRSGYYAWRQRDKSRQQQENEQLIEKIKNAYALYRKVCGSPRITEELRLKGYVVVRIELRDS